MTSGREEDCNGFSLGVDASFSGDAGNIVGSFTKLSKTDRGDYSANGT